MCFKSCLITQIASSAPCLVAPISHWNSLPYNQWWIWETCKIHDGGNPWSELIDRSSIPLIYWTLPLCGPSWARAAWGQPLCSIWRRFLLVGCMLGQWHISSWVWVWVKYNQFQEAFLSAVHAILLFQQFFFKDGNFTTDQFQECYCMKVQIQPGHPKIIQQATITRNRLCLSMPICILEPPVVWNLYRLHIRWRVETSL